MAGRERQQEWDREREREYERRYWEGRAEREQRELERLEYWTQYVASGGEKTRAAYDRWVDDQWWLGRQLAEQEEQDQWEQTERERLMRERRRQWEELQRQRENG